jgi:hypothetical protein
MPDPIIADPTQNPVPPTPTFPEVPDIPNIREIADTAPKTSVLPEITDTPPVMADQKPPKKNKGKLVATILGIFLLLGAVGAGVVLVGQKQLFQQKAYTKPTSFKDPCDIIKITAEDSGVCPKLDNKGTNNVSTYKTTFTIKNTTNKQHVLNIEKKSNYCLEPYGQWSDAVSTNICGSNPESNTTDITLEANETQTVEITRSSISGASCGSYQTDLSLNSIDGDTKCSGDVGMGNLASWGICQTGTACAETSNLCSSSTVDKTTLAPTESVLMSSVSTSPANEFWYGIYNVDNPTSPNVPKPVCVTSGGDVTTEQDKCPAGTYHLIFKDTSTDAKTTGSRSVKYADLFVVDKNWGDKQLIHAQINAWFGITGGQFSSSSPMCVAWVSVANPAVPDCTSLKLTTPGASASSLVVGQTYSFDLTAGGSAPITDVALSIHSGDTGQNCSDFTDVKKQSSGAETTTISWTPASAGTYTLFGRVWNDGITECRADCVDGIPRYSCASSSLCRIKVGVQSTSAPSCTSVKAYDTNWNLLDTAKLSALKAGDKVRFAISGTPVDQIDNARFTINGVLTTNVTLKEPGTYYTEYTIPAGVSSFTVTAEIHHLTLGWF